MTQSKNWIPVCLLGLGAVLFTLGLFLLIDSMRRGYDYHTPIDAAITVVESTDWELAGNDMPRTSRGYQLPPGTYTLELPKNLWESFGVLSINRADIRMVRWIRPYSKDTAKIVEITPQTAITERPLLYKKVAYEHQEADRALESPLLLQITTDYPILFQIKGWEHRLDFANTQRIDQQVISFYFGIVAILMLISFFVYFSSRIRAYFYYPIFLTFHAVSILTYEGIYVGSAFAQSPWLYPVMLLSIPLTVIYALKFLESFLELEISHPRTLRVLHGFKWIFCILLLQVFLIPFPTYWEIALKIQTVLVLVAAGVYPAIAAIRALDGKWEHRLIFATFIPHFIAVTCYMLQILGWIEPDKNDYFKLLGSTLTEMLLISVALGMLIFSIRKEKERSDQQAIHHLERAVSAEEAYRSKLETKVQERTAALEQADKEKQRLLEIISHDLRAPLYSIVQYTEISLDPEEHFTTAEYKGMLQDINYSSHSLFRLLENLLTWTKTNWEGVKPNTKPIQIREAVETNLDIYRVPISEKSIHVRVSGENLVVLADIDMLNTLFRNLLSNALAHTTRQGTLSIEWSADKDDSVIMQVKNTGPSIPADIAEEMSSGDPFDASRKRVSKGLGLRLSKALSDLNSWHFTIAPVDDGTVVTFRLPPPKA